MCELLHTSLDVQKMQGRPLLVALIRSQDLFFHAKDLFVGAIMVLGEAVISADRARRFDTLRGAPARPSASAIRTASIPHHRTPSASRTLRTMPAESVG